MNILVTGGAGFIGSHVADRLLGEHHRVFCLDNFDTYYDPQIKHSNLANAMLSPAFHLIEGDIRDSRCLDECFTRYPIDVVIHLAARAGVRPSLISPDLHYDVNIMGTLRLLEAMRRHGVSRMIFSSSSSVYGNNTKVPFSESDCVDMPISPYAASKKAGELLCYTYHHIYGFEIFCLRLFTVYGPRQRPDMAIHQFIGKISRGEPIVLYGDGSSKRDYTYVDDIVQGVINAMSCVRGYEIINLGGSQTIELRALISAIERIVGREAQLRWMPMQAGDVNCTFADITKAHRLLDYVPAYPLLRGLREFVEWHNHVENRSGSVHHVS
jgi:UDP-glucuronate 4-epimerase